MVTLKPTGIVTASPAVGTTPVDHVLISLHGPDAIAVTDPI